jgi:hypothetical protein
MVVPEYGGTRPGAAGRDVVIGASRLTGTDAVRGLAYRAYAYSRGRPAAGRTG